MVRYGYFLISLSLHGFFVVAAGWALFAEKPVTESLSTVSFVIVEPPVVQKAVPKVAKKTVKEVSSKPTRRTAKRKKSVSQERPQPTKKPGRANTETLQDQPELVANDESVNSDSVLVPDQGVMLDYTQRLKLFIEKHKRYPRRAVRLRQTGTVKVKVKIDLKGAFEEVKLVSPSDHAILDTASVDLLKRLGKFQPLPAGFQQATEFVIPIAYVIRGRR